MAPDPLGSMVYVPLSWAITTVGTAIRKPAVKASDWSNFLIRTMVKVKLYEIRNLPKMMILIAKKQTFTRNKRDLNLFYQLLNKVFST